MSKEMRKTLRELDFEHIPQDDGIDAWMKTYPGFRLFVAQTPKGDFLASVTVGKTEISIPGHVDDYWVVNFDSQNLEPAEA